MLTPTVILLALAVGVLAIATYVIAQRLESLTTALSAINLAPAAAPPAAGDGEEKVTDSLRLQACERLTLMLERISAANLLLRMPAAEGTTAREYTAALLLAIRQEYEYNVTQQIYVSDALWSVLLQARDNVSQLIVRAAEGADSAEQVVSRLRLMSSRQPTDAVAVAQGAVRKEAARVLA